MSEPERRWAGFFNSPEALETAYINLYRAFQERTREMKLVEERCKYVADALSVPIGLNDDRGNVIISFDWAVQMLIGKIKAAE